MSADASKNLKASDENAKKNVDVRNTSNIEFSVTI